MIADDFDRISDWMRENDADVLVDNLAPGASPERLAEVEKKLGFALPAGLRELWSAHDGQLSELNGFYESYDLLSTSLALVDSDMLPEFVQLIVKTPRAIAESGLSERELASRAWLKIAGRDSDGVAVNAETGRVFLVSHDDAPPLHLLADSVETWFSAFADRVEADDYEIEEGFGACYLSERNREAERRRAERERARNEEAERRSKLGATALMTEAVQKKSESLADDAFAQANGAEVREAILAILFDASPDFIATVLRTRLNDLTLTRARWERVAEGAAKIGNNAIRSIATKRAAES